MRLIILIVTFSTIILSCGQTSTKEKELELKQKELELREKEIAQQEKHNSSSDTSKRVVQQIQDSKENISLTHSDFKSFWVDFKNAVNSGNKNAVAEMTNIPFIDNTYENGKTGRLNASSIQQFIANYNKLFTSEVIKAMNLNKYRGWRAKDPKDDFDEGDLIKKDEYILEVFDNGISSFVFSKKGGLYKLSYIPFYS